jgi:hypothetical protein
MSSSQGDKSIKAPAEKKRKTTSKKVSTTGVMEYLQMSLPKESLKELYLDEARGRFLCRAVLQQLPEPSQQVVVRLECCGGQFPLAQAQIWCKSWGPKQMQELARWAILEPSSSEILKLTPEFYQGFKRALHSLDASPWNALTTQQIALLEQDSGEPFPAMTPEDLERYTQSQWDAVLHYLVGTPNLDIQPSKHLFSQPYNYPSSFLTLFFLSLSRSRSRHFAFFARN